MEPNSPPDERQRQGDVRRDRDEPQPQTDLRRSRSPPIDRAQDDILPPHYLRGGGRRSRFILSKENIEEVLQRYRNRDWTPDPEAERRRNLGPMERLQEDGQKLQANILAHPMIMISLEVSKSMTALCRAQDDCLFVQAGRSSGTRIECELRIRLDGADRLPRLRWTGRTNFYHFPCFNVMVDLNVLLPAQFQLSPDTTWGLMPRKWLEHKGCIDLDKLAAYIEAFKEYNGKYSEWSSMILEWSDAHRGCGKPTECACPAKPVPPEKPTLEGYTTGEESRCNLLDVCTHTNFWDIKEMYVLGARGFVKVGAETNWHSILFDTNGSREADHTIDD